MAERYIKVPITRFEANRKLVVETFVYLPRNNRFVRLRQIGQFFEPQILANYVSKGHADFFILNENLTETDPQKIVLHDFSAPLMGLDPEFSGEDNRQEFAVGSLLKKDKPEATQAPSQPSDNVLEFKKQDDEKAKTAETNALDSPENSKNSDGENILDFSSAKKKPKSDPSEDATNSQKKETGILDLPTVKGQQADEIDLEKEEKNQASEADLSLEQNERKEESAAAEPEKAQLAEEAPSLTAPDAKKKAPKVEALSPEEKEKIEKRKEAKKRFFEQRMHAIRERQVQEQKEREKRETLSAAKKKREDDIRKRHAEAEKLLEENRFSKGSESEGSRTVGGGASDSDPERKFSKGGDTEESRRVNGGTDQDNSKTVVKGKADETNLEEVRVEGDGKPKQHKSMLISTNKLEETMEKLKESYLQRHKDGDLDNFELTRLDPELEQEVERTIISNELGKKLVVLGMQLEAVRERERSSNSQGAEEIKENNEMRTRVLNKVEQVETNLIKNRKGETIDTDLRSELNIDLLKEEIIEAVREGKDPLEKVFSLTQRVEDIKTGLAKTENLIESKEVTKIIAAAAPGKTSTLEETLYAEATSGPEDDPDSTFRNVLSSDDPLRKDYYQRLAEDEEMRQSAERLAQHLKNTFINEISNYTAQLAIAQGFHDPGFLKDLVMAALVSLSEKSAAVSRAELPKFTQELLKKSETFEGLDTTCIDALQIIALVKEIITDSSFTAGAPKVDKKILEPALQNAMGKEEVFSLTFLERTKQFVERGIKLHDAGISFQLSREAILDLRRMCN